MSYIEIIKDIELALPDSLKLDYTEISEEELFSRVYGCLSRCGVVNYY